MAWISLDHGNYIRPLDTLELHFKNLTDSGTPMLCEHWSTSLVLRLGIPSSIPDPVPYLKRAWVLIGLQHPNAGSPVMPKIPFDPSSKPTLRVGPFDINSWQLTTFLTHPSAEDSNKVFSSLKSTETATCNWLPACQELLLHSSYWRIDGVGMMMLAHSFMTLLSSVFIHGPDAEWSAYHNPPRRASDVRSFDDLVKVYVDEETTPLRLRTAADRLVDDFATGVPSIGLPTKAVEAPMSWMPRSSARISTTLAADTTAAVVARCRERGLRVTSAVHASLIRVTATYPQHPEAKSYAAFVPVDLRHYLPAPWCTEECLVGAYSIGLPVCVSGVCRNDGMAGEEEEGKTWGEVSRELNAMYMRNLAQFWALELTSPYVRRATKLFNTPPPPGSPPLQTPDLSSLGKVERYVQREYACGKGQTVTVEDFWMGTEVLTKTIQCHAWMWRDNLCIAGCFNDRFYTKSFVAEVLEKVKSELLTGLRIAE